MEMHQGARAPTNLPLKNIVHNYLQKLNEKYYAAGSVKVR